MAARCQNDLMSNVEIRHATPLDAAIIGTVLAKAYARWQERLDDLPDVTGGIHDEIEAGRAWVALMDGKVVGCLMGGMHEDSWHLANVAVHPDTGGKGVGRRLINHAESLARGLGIGEMVLATHKDLPENIALYEHLGWKVTNTEGARVMMTLKL